jgi:alkylhydroperoxidase family enzyme
MSSTPRAVDNVTGAPMGLEEAAPELGKAFSHMARVATGSAKVDIVTRELVRIYSGQLAHCSICRNMRVTTAVDRGLTEDVVAQLADFEHSDLSDRHKAAVRYAHAFLVDPTSFDEADQAELQRHFRPDQIAELTLDLVRLRPGSKMTVATGNEPAHDDLIFV